MIVEDGCLRDYYPARIIRQTEEMDHMAEEMIGLSKLDSEELILGNQPVSVSELILGTDAIPWQGALKNGRRWPRRPVMIR